MHGKYTSVKISQTYRDCHESNKALNSRQNKNNTYFILWFTLFLFRFRIVLLQYFTYWQDKVLHKISLEDVINTTRNADANRNTKRNGVLPANYQLNGVREDAVQR